MRPFVAFQATLVPLLIAATGCDDPASPFVRASAYITDGASGEVVVAFGADPGDWSADPIQVDSAEVREDVLHVFGTHGGGCEEHEYAAVAWNGWLESNPVQVGVFIAHEDHDDPCDALLSPELRFDLDALRRDYAESYGAGPGRFVLRITAADEIGSDPTLVEYSF